MVYLLSHRIWHANLLSRLKSPHVEGCILTTNRAKYRNISLLSTQASFRSSNLTFFELKQARIQRRHIHFLPKINTVLPKMGSLARRSLTRTRRPWTSDDLWAMFSWLFVGHGLFILIGTTTFASLLLLLVNSLQFQEFLTEKVGGYLTRSTGLIVVFGDTIVPNWRNGKITFRDVRVKRCEPDNGPFELGDMRNNYSRFDLTIGRIDLTISLARYLEGKGLVSSVSVVGIRGTLDRRSTFPAPNWKYTPQSGDFDLEGLSIRDMLINVQSPGGFRPYSVSVISAEIPRLRKGWLFYDIMCSESLVGVFDNCLFSLHTPQIEIDEGHEVVNGPNIKTCMYRKMRHLKIDGIPVDHINTGASGPLGWITRGTVDINAFIQLPSNYRPPNTDIIDSLTNTIDHIKEQIVVSILKSGSKDEPVRVFGSAPVEEAWPALKLPEGLDDKIAEDIRNLHSKLNSLRISLLGPIAEKMQRRWRQALLNIDEGAMETPEKAACHFLRAKPDVVSMKVEVRFRNIRAHVPLNTEDLSYLNSALIRPVIGYINDHRPYIPTSCYFEMPLAESFEGAWTMHDSGLVDKLSEGVAYSFSTLVHDKNRRMHRIKRVGLWSLYSVLKNITLILSPHIDSIEDSMHPSYN